jgi:hypothetical protein
LATGSALTFDGSTFKVSTANSSYIGLINGTTKGVRFGADTTGSSIEGVDNTGIASYQPLTFGGSYLSYAISGSEQMRLTSTGLGIGTTSPASKLGVFPSNDGGIALQDSGGNARGLFFINNSGGTFNTGIRAQNYWLDFDASGSAQNAIRFFTGTGAIGTGTERMRIDSSGNVGIGTSSPSSSAILDAQSTTKGVRMPNMTTTQKNAISSPAAGLMVFDTTLSKLCVYTGAAWQTITSV